MTLDPLASLDRSTLRERALEALRTAITSGVYRPGDHVGEVDLANHLGVSRGTVREALRHLQQEGLVTPGKRGMLRVNSLTRKEVRELFRVRAALEGLAVRELMASPERDAKAKRLRESLSRFADRNLDFAGRLEADLGFHELLCQLSDNSMLLEAWRQLEGRIRVTIISGAADRVPRMMSRDHHAPIVEAIDSGDIPAAIAVVEEHMARAADQFADPDQVAS
jgi:DNA-binding GntR family transcriptional regulator